MSSSSAQLVLDQTRRLAERLQAVLESRMVVERAVGIMMSRSGVTEDEARKQLQTLSQDQHQKLPVVTRQLVDAAVRRARQQHRG